MTDVEVKIELGHRAAPRANPTKENFKHEWTLYVRGAEQFDIEHFVEKVVFHLHPSFANPTRVCKKPPYFVQEVGYAGFELPIEIYLKNNAEPRKIKFTYDLFLNLNEPVSRIRHEKVTFQNPTEEFKKKLLKGNGVLIRPVEEAQFKNVFVSPIKIKNLLKKHRSSFEPNKERLSWSGLDENLKNSNSKSPDRAILNKSLPVATNYASGRPQSIQSDASHGSPEKPSKERNLSKVSSSSWKLTNSPVSNPLSTSKRLSESPHKNEQPSKKRKRSSSFSDKKTKDKDRVTEEENDMVKNNERETEWYNDKECEREKDNKRKRKKEREQEKEQIRLQEYEKEIVKERENIMGIEKESVKDKQRQKEKTDRVTEKQKDKSHKNSHNHRKRAHNERDNEKENSSREQLKDIKLNRSSNFENNANIIRDKKQEQARDNTKTHETFSLDNHTNSVKFEKSNHKLKSHKEERHTKVENTSPNEVKQKEKFGERKTVCEAEIKLQPNKKSNEIKMAASNTSVHKPLLQVIKRKLLGDPPLSDSSDLLSDVSFLTSSSSIESDSKSNMDNKSNNPPEKFSLDNRKIFSVNHEKSNHKEKSHKEKRHTKVENTSSNEVERKEKFGERKTVCEAEIKLQPNKKSKEIKMAASNTSVHKPLLQVTTRRLLDNLSLSDSSDSLPDVSFLTSSSSIESDSKSIMDCTDHKSSSSKLHNSSSKESKPAKKSVLGMLMAELDEDDSDEEMAALSLMSSSYSLSSKRSPKQNDKLFHVEPNYQPSSCKCKLKLSPAEIRQAIDEIKSNLSQNNLRGFVNSSRKKTPKCSTSKRTPVKNENVAVKSERPVSTIEHVEDVDKCKMREYTTGTCVGDEVPEKLTESVNEDLTELLELESRLNAITDPKKLVKFVLLIIQLDKYEILEDSSFDCDLSSLDKETLQQIKQNLDSYDLKVQSG